LHFALIYSILYLPLYSMMCLHICRMIPSDLGNLGQGME
jgi:hypothetical protein